MKRQAFKMYLNPGMKEEYKRRHQNLFPELRRLLSEAGVRNYSIYLDEDTDTLFAYQELEGEGGSQDLGATEICQKWWAYMADIMKTNPDNSPVSIPLPEMFHMD
ncbi:MAG: L-rhamnose mutarotase [Bacteroidales bacterium]|jgi:L-rhamnose mutarotase|nr:L-rhamnose mutarotase [Bacteroidales bacterium]MBO7378553.1 L-rhamnose mutarotase [Bacteroidales bacterium]MBP5214752.1 L-rhamnose mutarotase [Bacteroidales bacterium]MBP5764613.1 L-rhamnose mutarotase [Bacteroidales bacterium]